MEGREPSILPRLAAKGVTRSVGRGAIVTHQGEAVASLHLVQAGAIRLSTLFPDGREVVLALLGAGEVFDELALLGGGPSPVEARAVEESRLLALPVERLRRTVAEDAEVAVELLRAVATRLRRSSEALQDALLHDVSTRLWRRLCELARDHGARTGSGIAVRLSLTQEDLARMVGASRETVNRSIASLAARGLVVTRDRRYVIPDPDAAQEAGTSSRGLLDLSAGLCLPAGQPL